MSRDDLAETLAWRAGWHFICHGFHWEAHEVLEPVWMALQPDTPERRFVQAVIQTANAALKLRMDRPKATLRLCGIADKHLDACGDAESIMRLPLVEVRTYLDAVRSRAVGRTMP